MIKHLRVLVVLFSVLWAAPSAGASSATVDGTTLTFVAGAGEANTVSIAYDAMLASYRITDSTATATGGPGCGAIDHEINCDGIAVKSIVINLRDGNDRWLGGDISIMPSVDGGPGNDELTGVGFLNGGDGDDALRAPDAGGMLNGDGGNDVLVGGLGDDRLDGGPGDDLLIGNDGTDKFVGGLGLDRIDASGDGGKTIDCQGRDDDVVQGLDAEAGGIESIQRINCVPAPQISVAVPRVRLRQFIARGMRFTVACNRPCAVYWEVTIDRKTAKLIHQKGDWLSRHPIAVDEDGFRTPFQNSQKYTARVTGFATKKALRKLRSLTVTLGVQGFSQSGLDVTQFKKVTLR